jgi:hypothetical protein
LLSINDFHGNLAPPGTLTLPGGVRTPAAPTPRDRITQAP